MSETQPRADWGEPRTREITWYPQAAAHEAAAQMSGLEFVRAIRSGLVPPAPIRSLIPLEFTVVEEGEVELVCRPDELMLNPAGTVHGGILCTLMDTAMGIAVRTTAPAGVTFVTVELKVSFLRPLPSDGGEVRVRGEVLKAGRTIRYAEGHAYGPDGRLAGHGTMTLAPGRT